jgi:two-component system cell cycle response regulator CpdR
LDISVIDELPPGRKPIQTVHRFDSNRLKVWKFLRDEIEKGRILMDWISKPEVVFARTTPSQKLLIVSACQKAGHIVADFPDGDQALEALNAMGFDLLLTDIVMPGVDGVELARRAAEVDPAMKIVFITGFAAVALNPANQAPSKAKVLSKPFHLRELVAEVEKVMAA